MVITNADVEGEIITLGPYQGYAIQAVWPSGVVGTLTVLASVDGVAWSALPSSTQAVSSANSYLWNVGATTLANYDFARLYFTYTSGAGTIVSTVNLKGPTG